MAVGSFATTTLAQARTALGARLYDPTHVRWVAAELTVYIQQALRTYNSLTSHFRAQASLSTDPLVTFYDLPTELPSLRAQTYTVEEAINQLAYHLLEPPPVAGVWSGTHQYTTEVLVEALGAARDEFLLETAGVITSSDLLVDPVPASGRVDLDEAIINLRRLAWKTSNGIVTILRREDEWGLNSYLTGWKTAASTPPKVYSVGVTPPLVVQLAPLTTVAGTLQLLTINRGAVPDLSIAGQSLGVPNDWAWVVIFGALVELLRRDGLALDPARAAYCESRWTHGIAQAKNAAVVVAAQIDGVPCQLTSVQDADRYSAAWGMVRGVPKRGITAGQTLFAVWPPAGVPSGGGSWTVALDVVRNAPVPLVDGDFLQVGPEVLDGLYAYAEHLALLKEGAAQVQATNGLLQQFMELCGTTIDIQRASQPDRSSILDQTTQDERVTAYATTADGDRS